jgi:hypothetical protein
LKQKFRKRIRGTRRQKGKAFPIIPSQQKLKTKLPRAKGKPEPEHIGRMKRMITKMKQAKKSLKRMERQLEKSAKEVEKIASRARKKRLPIPRPPF